jgi:hypothetical protein
LDRATVAACSIPIDALPLEHRAREKPTVKKTLTVAAIMVVAGHCRICAGTLPLIDTNAPRERRRAHTPEAGQFELTPSFQWLTSPMGPSASLTSSARSLAWNLPRPSILFSLVARGLHVVFRIYLWGRIKIPFQITTVFLAVLRDLDLS